MTEEAESLVKRGLQLFCQDPLLYEDQGPMLLKRSWLDYAQAEALWISQLQQLLNSDNELSGAHEDLPQIEPQCAVENWRQLKDGEGMSNPGLLSIGHLANRELRGQSR